MFRLRACLKITRDAVFDERAGWGGTMRGKALGWALTKKRRWWLARKRSHVLNGRLETTVRPVHRPFRTNPLARVTRHWRVWLISEVASRQVPVAHDKGRGPLLAGHDGCPTGIDKVVAGALTKKRRWWLARKRSHVLKGRLETTAPTCPSSLQDEFIGARYQTLACLARRAFPSML
jgi:hypothetical protein